MLEELGPINPAVNMTTQKYGVNGFDITSLFFYYPTLFDAKVSPAFDARFFGAMDAAIFIVDLTDASSLDKIAAQFSASTFAPGFKVFIMLFDDSIESDLSTDIAKSKLPEHFIVCPGILTPQEAGKETQDFTAIQFISAIVEALKAESMSALAPFDDSRALAKAVSTKASKENKYAAPAPFAKSHMKPVLGARSSNVSSTELGKVTKLSITRPTAAGAGSTLER